MWNFDDSFSDVDGVFICSNRLVDESDGLVVMWSIEDFTFSFSFTSLLSDVVLDRLELGFPSVKSKTNSFNRMFPSNEVLTFFLIYFFIYHLRS